MTNKLVVIINSLKVPKIKKILLYEMKFLVPNYSCLQNPRLGGYRPPDPRTLCPLSSTDFVEPPTPLPRTKFLGKLAWAPSWWRIKPTKASQLHIIDSYPSCSDSYCKQNYVVTHPVALWLTESLHRFSLPTFCWSILPTASKMPQILNFPL